METFTTCLENIGGDSILFPGYISNNILDLDVEISINNLIEVDELTNSVTFDFMCFIQWNDYRFIMLELIEKIREFSNSAADQITYSGIDITQAVNTQDIFGQQTAIWLPSLLFPGF